MNHLDEWVRGEVHTNGLENFWSLFKRCYHGTYVHMSPKHLHRYVAEQTGRYNNRKACDGVRLATALLGVDGRRLTYKELTDGGQA